MEALEVRLSGLLEAAALLEGGATRSAPIREAPQMSQGPAPTIASDLNSNVAWWVERLADQLRHVEHAAQVLRAQAAAYTEVDLSVAERFTGATSTLDGGDPAPPAGVRAL